MIRTSLKLMVGVLLSGCTVNTYHQTSYDPTFKTETTITQDIFLGGVAGTQETKEVTTPLPPPEVKTVVLGNIHIRKECAVYVPLPVPEPKRIDIKELDAAPTAQVINAIALANVKALHQQLKEYGEAQRKHYADYVKRCVVK